MFLFNHQAQLKSRLSVACGAVAFILITGGPAQAGRPGVLGRPSVGAGGVLGNGDSFFPAISADGRFVAFMSNASNLVSGDTNGERDVFVRDRAQGTTERVSVATGGAQGIGSSGGPSISGDGRYVAFDSGAANLVAGDTNRKSDIFVRDRKTGKTELVSVATDGTRVMATVRPQSFRPTAATSCFSPALTI